MLCCLTCLTCPGLVMRVYNMTCILDAVVSVSSDGSQ